MEKSSKVIIILTILILSIVIFYQVGVLAKTIITENQRIKNYNLYLLEEENKIPDSKIEYGKYSVTYNSLLKSEEDYSKLYLYENKTFDLVVYINGGVIEYKGLYIINDNIVTLMNVNNECTEYMNCNLSEFSLTIESKTELKFNLRVGYLGKNSIFKYEV